MSSSPELCAPPSVSTAYCSICEMNAWVSRMDRRTSDGGREPKTNHDKCEGSDQDKVLEEDVRQKVRLINVEENY